MTNKIGIGIDIGGTSIKGAAVSDDGKIYDKFVLPIDKSFSGEEIISQLIELVGQYLIDNSLTDKICGIGLGIPGAIDSKNGIITFSNNLEWKEIPVVKMFQNKFNVPIKITNDANAAALGEYRFGVGKNYQSMIMVTLGTGFGSGIIFNGNIIEGKDGKGAEIGHTSLYVDGLSCTCGRKGCLEQYASATALIRQTKEMMDKFPNSIMWNEKEIEGKISGKTAFNAAKKGDKAATDVVNQYVKYLSEGILNICNALRPELIVLSGGVANQKEYLLDKVNAYIKEKQYGFIHYPSVEVKIATLGYNSGIIGAACLVI